MFLLGSMVFTLDSDPDVRLVFSFLSLRSLSEKHSRGSLSTSSPTTLTYIWMSRSLLCANISCSCYTAVLCMYNVIVHQK